MQPVEGELAEIIKVDANGRLQIPRERRDALLAEFDRSGMTGAAFARHYGIKYTTFAHWIRSRREQKNKGQHSKSPSTRSQFLMIEAAAGTGSVNNGALQVELPNGCRLSLRSRQEAKLAASLINALGTEK